MFKWIFQTGLCLAAIAMAGCPPETPTAAFEGAPAIGEAPLSVLFVDASNPGTANITAWQWDFGDGMTSSSRNPTHIYETPGLYNVSLTVTTSLGTNTELKRDYINVVELPVAEFEAKPAAGSAPLTVVFSDMTAPGSAPITGWLWNFGDRTPTSAQQNPTHVYTAPGVYTVSLTVTTDVGEDTMEKTQLINVTGNPVAAFSADTTNGVAPLAVMFADESEVGTAIVDSWMWDFGDGNMSTDQNPSHTYADPGTYTVSLTIATSSGEDMVVKEDFVVVDNGPTAAFTGEPVMGSAPLTVVFSDISDPGSRPIESWLWDFGDGGLLSTRQNPTRTFTNPGVYTVALTVTTGAGENTLEQEGYITVTPGVSFTANQTLGQGNLTVQFVDASETGGLEITGWMWDFGDGGMATTRNPEHTYEEPGIYDVALTIMTELGPSTATEAGLITVSPDTNFSAEPASGLPPLEVAFTDETVAGALAISAWSWDFGDGGTSEDQSPAHIFETPGAYTVTLETTTDIGTGMEAKTAFIEVEPVVDFIASDQTGQGSLGVNFQDATNAGNLNILSWFWQFGDGATSTQQNPSHTYSAIGSYDVILTITTALGDHVERKEAHIQVGPDVDFSVDKVAGQGTLEVNFTDMTEAGMLEVEGWAWSFGDGGASDEQNPNHLYEMPGLYTVSLTVTTSQGEAVSAKEDLVLVTPVVTIDAVQTSGATPFEVSLLDITMTGSFEVAGWLWELGDGNTSTEQNPVHTYEDPGTYTVTLTIMTNGGEFSRTMPSYITALRGPTAAFTHSVSRGGDPEDPVTVTFANMSLPGDSPILNQTWEFGESADADEELTMDENPVVVYPGVAFDTIPQDVSLTVRTFVAADTLLRENLFAAKSAKSTLAPELLAAADLTRIAADHSGDVWASGVLPETGEVVVVRLSPDGKQRWGQLFDVEGALAFTALHAPGDGTVRAAGTWRMGDESVLFLTQLDAAGNTDWETTYAGVAPVRTSGLTTRSDGATVVAGVASDSIQESGPLFFIVFDGSGVCVDHYTTDRKVGASQTPIASGGNGDLLLGLPGGENDPTLERFSLENRLWLGTEALLPAVPCGVYGAILGGNNVVEVNNADEKRALFIGAEKNLTYLGPVLTAATPTAFAEVEGDLYLVWIDRKADHQNLSVQKYLLMP